MKNEIKHYQQLIAEIDEKLLDESLSEKQIDKLLDRQERYTKEISRIRNAFVLSF